MRLCWSGLDGWAIERKKRWLIKSLKNDERHKVASSGYSLWGGRLGKEGLEDRWGNEGCTWAGHSREGVIGIG